MESITQKSAVIIDGSAIVYRAFYALPRFTAADSTPVGAVYGFATMFFSIINMFNPKYIAVALDTPKPTFRKKLFDSYQAHRAPTPDELKQQFPIVYDFLEKAGIPMFKKEGYEADDVIGTMVNRLYKEDKNIILYIITGDRDLLQLVNGSVRVGMPKKGISSLNIFDKKAVYKKMGVSPNQVIDFKALTGDPSDNYKGVPGIGPRTAQSLITKYNSLEGIYENINKLNEAHKDLLLKYKKQVFLCKDLATIRINVPISVSFRNLVYFGIKIKPLVPFLEKYGLESIKKRIIKLSQIQSSFKEESSTSKKNNNQLSFF